MPKGILVDYEWCSGCRACEMACRVEHDFPKGENGVVMVQAGPYEVSGGGDEWVWVNMPVFTDQCDLCAARREAGKLPTCVHHCQAAVMRFGELTDLQEALAAKPKQVLFSLA